MIKPSDFRFTDRQLYAICHRAALAICPDPEMVPEVLFRLYCEGAERTTGDFALYIANLLERIARAQQGGH